jgi:hypothetical protein
MQSFYDTFGPFGESHTSAVTVIYVELDGSCLSDTVPLLLVVLLNLFMMCF